MGYSQNQFSNYERHSEATHNQNLSNRLQWTKTQVPHRRWNKTTGIFLCVRLLQFSFWYSFHPRVTAVADGRLQLNTHAKRTVSCGTIQPCKRSVHHYGGYSKMRYKKLVTRVQSHASAMSLLVSGIALYKSDQQQQQINTDEVVFFLCICLSSKQLLKISLTWQHHRNLLRVATCPQTGVYATGNRSALRIWAYDQGVWTWTISEIVTVRRLSHKKALLSAHICLFLVFKRCCTIMLI